MTINKIACGIIAATLVVTAAPHAAVAQGPKAPAGAKAGDKEMTCTQVTSERAEINQAVTDGAERKQKAAKVKKGLFGFAKTFAGMAIPGAASSLGGGSMIGTMAAQSAASTASQTVANVGAGTDSPVEAKASTAQQARLDRLDKIGAYRQCEG